MSSHRCQHLFEQNAIDGRVNLVAQIDGSLTEQVLDELPHVGQSLLFRSRDDCDRSVARLAAHAGRQALRRHDLSRGVHERKLDRRFPARARFPASCAGPAHSSASGEIPRTSTARFSTEPLQEMFGQQRNVVRPLAQGRQRQRERVQPKEQVRAEFLRAASPARGPCWWRR